MEKRAEISSVCSRGIVRYVVMLHLLTTAGSVLSHDGQQRVVRRTRLLLTYIRSGNDSRPAVLRRLPSVTSVNQQTGLNIPARRTYLCPTFAKVHPDARQLELLALDQRKFVGRLR